MLASLRPTLYVQLSPQRVTVRNAKTRTEVSEVPEVALSRMKGKTSILAVGNDARAPRDADAQVVNPFAHPRSLVSDFLPAEQLLKAFVRRALPNFLFGAAPKIVMHPLGDPEGGFTGVEARALREMAMGAGASDVVVWQGPALTDAQLLAGEFPPGGRVLA
jgi:rod shape-determining protein MreB